MSDQLQKRYENNAEFRTVVHAIESMIRTTGMTPSEMREAVFMAHYRFEMLNPKIAMAQCQQRMEAFLKIHGIVDEFPIKSPNSEGEG